MCMQSLIKDLPFELKEIIKEYIFTNCSKCKNKYHINNLKIDCTVFGYISVFSDDYDLWMEDRNDLFIHKYLCKNCINYYHRNGFVVKN